MVCSAPGFYPLQYFDDWTFETRSMSEWMKQVSLSPDTPEAKTQSPTRKSKTVNPEP